MQRKLTMRTLSITLLTLAGQAFAFPDVDVNGSERMRLLPGDDYCFAIVEIKNRFGVYNRVETMETEHGKVQFKYTTIGSHNETDHDIIEEFRLPDGVIADPPYLELPDGDTGHICLVEYFGF